ncbi:helix-turn-helix transcriptional regulator [Microbacterium sp. 2P01SA-2]|uniref:helix-turn-helix domain-containing protein n=1 Tax=unclassified Microbacterium TaxID=2609290 RepID=UPI0039A320C6
MPTGKTPEPGPLSRHVARLLSSEIARRGWRQIDIAARAGMSASQLSRALAAKKVFTLDQLDAVCRAVGIAIADVVVMPDGRRRRGPGAIDIARVDGSGASRRSGQAVAKAPHDDRGADDGNG